MTALRAKLYEPPPPEPPMRSLSDFQKNPGAETAQGLRLGRRGNIITDTYLRGLSVSGGGPAGDYLSKSTQPATVVQALQANLVCARAGAKFERPEGNYSAIPIISDVGVGGYWVDPDTGSIPETGMIFASVKPTSKLVAARCDISRMLNITTNKLAERTANRELVRSLAVALDRAALVGTGSDGQPIGITSTPGVGSTSGATFSVSTATELIRMVEAGNASPSAFAMSPATGKLLRTREQGVAGPPPFIFENGKILGVPAYVTSSMPDNLIICGDFSQLLILAESVEIIVDPYSQSITGGLQIVLLSFCDTVIQHAAAFAFAEGVS